VTAWHKSSGAASAHGESTQQPMIRPLQQQFMI
jgi:hypothetical protein